MAERKAVNKYYPPSWDPSKGSVNQFRGQHPLRDRAKKLDQGILVVRFEMPFNIWCGGCERHIAKGVRFNAEKKAIGNYFTTKILEFSMKCPTCTNRIQIQTDPKNTEYVVSGGGRRKVEEFDAEEAGAVQFMDDATREKVDKDPMFALDIRGANKKKADSDAEQIQELISYQDQLLDDYAISRKMRKSFRETKKELAEEAVEAKRDFLPYPLLKPSMDDELQASEVWFGKKIDSKRRKLQRLALRHSSILPGGNGHENPIDLVVHKNLDLACIRKVLKEKKNSLNPAVRKRPKMKMSSLVEYASSSSE